MNSPYSTLKAAWHIDRIQQFRDGGPVQPIELQLILSDYCNHDCHFCAYRASDGLSSEQFVEYKDGLRNHNPNRMLSLEKASEILHDAVDIGVKSVIFTGGGEPTAHPHHMDLFRLALDLGLDCSLNTNGCVFRDGWEEVLPRFKYVRFSIDAANPEEYGKIRGIKPTFYGKMLRNLTRLCVEVENQGTGCIVGTGYVVTPDNWVNLDEGVRNIRETGAKYVRLAVMQTTKGVEPFGESYSRASEASKKVGELATDDFSVVNLFDGLAGERPDYGFCGFQYVVVYVGANQKVYRCCYTAYTAHGEVGDLSGMSLLDWYKGRDALLVGFDARSCTTCPLNEKNRTINYMIDKEPLHVNFV